jgi:hypothetical protein
MDTQKITILEKELADAQWDLNYHSSKVEKAECLIELFTKKLEALKEEVKVKEAFEDVC